MPMPNTALTDRINDAIALIPACGRACSAA
jgi:hypothetical protein